MKPSSLKRILSLICVVALAFGLVGTSALAAVPMMGGAVAETPAGEHAGHTHVAAERPATQVGVRSTPTKDSDAELMAADTYTYTGGAAPSGYFSAVGTLDYTTASGYTTTATKSFAGGVQFTVKGTATVTVVAKAVNKGAPGLKGTALVADDAKQSKDGFRPSSDTTFTYTGLAAGTYIVGNIRSSGSSVGIKSITVVEAAACEHEWGEGEITTPATCTAEGVRTYTCSKCNSTKTEAITKLDHSYTVPVSDEVAPSCYQAGKTAVKKCATCEATQGGDPIPATGAHSYGDDGKCTTPGCTAVDPDKCAHTNMVTVKHEDATCTEDGVVGGEYCPTCHLNEAEATEVLPATGHDFDPTTGVCKNGCGTVRNTSFIAAAGDLESAYALWPIENGTWTAYVVDSTGNETQLDDQLIRQYPGYLRVDALGLKAGTYTIKVTNGSKTLTTEPLTVKAHDRSGFAFVNGTASGAYNDDGTLKANAEVIYVTKASDIEQYQKSEVWNNKDNKATANPVCVRVIGHVKLSNVMGFQDWATGLTVEGVGNDALLTGGGVFVKGSTNVEVRNLGVMHVPSSGKNDLIAVEQTNDHIWVHNNDLFYGFAGSGDQAKGDGSLDVKDAEYCSFSYNHFWDSGKCSLLGNGSSENYITYHHNWFDHSDSRHPRTRGGDKGGNVHVYNNYYDGVSKYGVGTTSGGSTSRCSVFIEANYFRNTKYPIMNSKQASDSNGSGGSNTFSGDNPGFNKVWNNVMVGSKNFVSQLDDPASFDGYVVSSRDAKVPDSVSAGGSKYNNFDTSMDLGVATVQEPKDAVITVTKWAGRVQGGDIQYVFNDATEDTNYAVIEELNNILNSYQTKLAKVGGTVTGASTAEHVHRPGTWITTKAPGCDPVTKKLVNGTETQYCLDCGEELDTRSVDGAHSNDGQGVCKVCGTGVANGGGPVVNPNSKILKASDFKDDGLTTVTQAMLDAKYSGYFKVVGTVKTGESSSTKHILDHLTLAKAGDAGISFTVSYGPAEVAVKASSNKSANTSTLVVKNASGTNMADKTGATSVNVSKNVSDATTVSYSLPAGTYTVCSAAGNANDLRLVELVVTEAEVACEHATTTHTDAVPATCTTGGNIEYWTCSECKKTFLDAACTTEVDDVTTEELGHDMTRKVSDAVAVTCLTDGKTAVMGCSRCDHTEGGEVIKAVGHHTEATRVKPGTESTATCTKPGSFTEETYCTVCKEVLNTEEKVGVLAPHKLTKTEGKAATCAEAGYEAYWTCSECQQKFSDAEGKNKIDAVVTIPKSTTHGETEVRNAKPATATEEGYTGDTYCKTCGQKIADGTTIPKITGSMSKLLKATDQDASADVKALVAAGTDVSVNSSKWGAGKDFKMGGNDTVKDFFTVHYGEKSKIDVSAEPKTWDVENNYYATEANATRFNFGATYGSKTADDYTIGFTTAKPATVKVWWVQGGNYHDDAKNKDYPVRNMQILNSSYTQVAKSNETAATSAKNEAEFSELKLTAGGAYYLCGETGTNYVFMVEVIEEGDIARTWAKPTTPVDPPACTHTNKTHTAAKGATCEADGNIEYWTCSDCHKMFSDEACTKEVTAAAVVVGKTGHDMQVTTPAVPATCKAEGKTAVLTCKNGCGKTEGGAPISKLPHTEATRQDNVQGATCTVPGSYDEVTYCSVCGDVLKTDHKTGVTLPHDLKEVPGTAKAPTATEPGKEADKKCANCDYVEPGKVIPATGEEPTVNKAALAEAIKKAETAKGTATVSTDGSTVSTSAKWVTADEMKALTDAIDAAKAMNDKTDATQAEVDKAVTDLNAAVTAFETAKKAGTKSNGGGGGGGGGRPSGGNSKPATEDLDDTKVPLAGGPELNSKDHTAYITGYPDGTVGAERNITRQETAAIFYRLLTEQSKAVYGTSANDFADIADDHWAVKEISTLAKAGIVKGLPDGSFGPEQSITRAEFVTMAARFFTVNTTGTNPFADVAGHWAEKEILFAYSKGWVNGLPDGSFAPDQLITRAEAMRIINNVLDRKVDAAGVIEGAKQFSDVSESVWYYYDVMEATNGHTYTHEDGAAERWTELSK